MNKNRGLLQERELNTMKREKYDKLVFGSEHTEATKPFMSVVLATKGNKTKLLGECIKSLQNQTFQGFEIVLVFSIFPDGLENLLKTCRITALKESGSTLGAARNLGVKHARGELIVFIDDDCEAPEDWLKTIYSTFQRYPSLSCLGGAHLTPAEEREKDPLRFVLGSFTESHMQKVYSDRSAVGKISGCNVTYRKAVFNEIGYLNETLKSGEDWEFHIRLAESKYNLRFDPNILVWHHRQGLKHVFLGNSKIVPFFPSWKTLKYSRYESFFAQFYLTNLLFLILFVTLFISPFVFSLLLLFILLSHFTFTAVRTRTYNWRIVYYPLAIIVTLSRLMGFYFGLFKYMAFKLRHQFSLSP